MKKIFLLLLLVPLGCKIAPLSNRGDVDRLTAFMIMCEKDINRTRQVILERDIVKILSHLQFMNSGGSKFYLLERESTTRMIKAVTEGVYSDYILINRKGTVIYTMSNNDLFSKNVKSHLRHSPLNESFRNRDKDIHFQAARFSGVSDASHLFISCRVTGGDTFPGIIVLQVDTSKIMELVNADTHILDRKGRYLLSREKGFTGLNAENDVAPDAYNNGPGQADAIARSGRPFTYRNLEWILLSE